MKREDILKRRKKENLRLLEILVKDKIFIASGYFNPKTRLKSLRKGMRSIAGKGLIQSYSLKKICSYNFYTVYVLNYQTVNELDGNSYTKAFYVDNDFNYN